MVARALERYERLDNFVPMAARLAVAGIRESLQWAAIGEPTEALRLLVPAAMRVGFALTMRPTSGALNILRKTLDRASHRIQRQVQDPHALAV